MDDQGVQKDIVTFKKVDVNLQIMVLLNDLYFQLEALDPEASQEIKLAMRSLDKYPLQMSSADSCYILQGFDRKLCKYVDEQIFSKNTDLLEDEASRSSLAKYIKSIEKPKILVLDSEDDSDEAITNTNQDNNINVLSDELKQCPKYYKLHEHPESKSEAVIIALYFQQLEYPSRPAFKKKELMLKAQQYCTKTILDWSFVNILEKKRKLLKKEHCDGEEQYLLTCYGKEVGKNIMEVRIRENELYMSDIRHREGEHTHSEVCKIHGCEGYRVSQIPYREHLFIDMPPETYEIIMLVDNNEPELLKDQEDNQIFKIETRSLKVGDILWVARSKLNFRELVLPYIVERKRLDDFAASIKDGRFHEQKFRLRKCGLRNVIYLIEDYQGKKNIGLPMATLNQAKINTRVQDGFLIQHTDSLNGTKRFLDLMTMRLINDLKGIHLRGTNTDIGRRELRTFDYFNASSSKTKPLTVKELFIKMLLQLKGLSVEKALAITKVFDSPKSLMNAYGQCDPRDGELLLANLRYNKITPRVGPAISKIIYMLFNKMDNC